jgi:hypothetical protein
MQEIQRPLAENEILIGNEIIRIKPVKLKYMIDGFYGYYTLLRKMGLMKLLAYSDGKDVLNNFLIGLFDNDQETINVFLEELTEIKIKELLTIVQKVNELEDEDTEKNV